MKTKEYVKKYNLDKTNKFNHTHFVQDLSIDFLTLLEVGKAKENIKGFENAVRAIRMKWDAVHNKTIDGGLPDKLWNYFYAVIVMKLKEELFPKELERRKKIQEERKRIYEERKRMYDDIGSNWVDDMFSGMVNDFFNFMFRGMQKPISSFEFFELDSEVAQPQDVYQKFRELSFKFHPDHGGTIEGFSELVEAKNKCLSYLKNKGELK